MSLPQPPYGFALYKIAILKKGAFVQDVLPHNTSDPVIRDGSAYSISETCTATIFMHHLIVIIIFTNIIIISIKQTAISAQRGIGCIDVHILNLGASWGWVVKAITQERAQDTL
jgi:hypothetical protein